MAENHPFARYVAALGRGPGRSRDLEEDEAREAMGAILRGDVEPEQLGAFLMLMRYKRETPAELAGFVKAARETLEKTGNGPAIDLDWPSYADRHKQLPWFVLAALLLAENGVKVLMHGIDGRGEAPLSTPAALAALGIRPCVSLEQAARNIESGGFAYLRLESLSPALGRLFGLRPILGLRSPVNSLARELNPMAAAHQIQGVFHPAYMALHQQAALRLGQKHAAVFKGGGGEAQRNPDKACPVARVRDGAAAEEEWPALIPGARVRWREEPLDLARIAALWSGEIEDTAPIAAVTGTAALALALVGRVPGMGAAQEMAADMWQARDRARFSAA